MEYKAVIGIDRLEITYATAAETKEWLSSVPEGEKVTLNEITLRREASRQYKCEFSVWGKDYDSDSNILYDRLWGTLFFGSYNKNRPYVYLLYENSILYDEYALATRFYIQDALNLEYLRISKLDICVDFNYNAINRFYLFYKDETLDLYINGNRILDMTERVKGVSHNADYSSRKRPFSRHKPIICNKPHTLELCAYNKSEEIAESNKDYIQEHIGFNRIFRFEVRCRNYKVLHISLKRLGITDTDLYSRLQMESTLLLLYDDLLERLIYFRCKRRKLNLVYELLKPKAKKELPLEDVSAGADVYRLR